jgi:thiamine-monophosphate kinase
LGLEIVLGNTGLCAPEAVHRLERPEPRVHAGMALAGLANACIDVSDGLAADLGHILSASGVGASLSWVALPIPSAVRRYIGCSEGEDWMPLTAGDDYELCFTVPSCSEAELAGRLVEFDCSCVRIGRIEEQSGLRLVKDGQIVNFQSSGFQHFRGSTANG